MAKGYNVVDVRNNKHKYPSPAPHLDHLSIIYDSYIETDKYQSDKSLLSNTPGYANIDDVINTLLAYLLRYASQELTSEWKLTRLSGNLYRVDLDNKGQVRLKFHQDKNNVVLIEFEIRDRSHLKYDYAMGVV